MRFMKDFNYSYWETKHYFKTFDLIVVGSGIVGLSTAISYKTKNKKAKILILERGLIPNGASTKNAGFACFGSAGELLDDLSHMPSESVWETVNMRWQGLQLLRKRLKDKNMDFRSHGGYELFKDDKNYTTCKQNINFLNGEIKRVIGLKNCYTEIGHESTIFRNVKGSILNAYEGQIDTALMMTNLLQLTRKNDIEVLNNITVTSMKEVNERVELVSDAGIFKAKKVVVATNGFAKSLLKIKDLNPARAQVLITKPIAGLKLKGTFHFNKGYYYFRNIDNRVLFGGGRNLDFKGETTTEQHLNKMIQEELDRLLKEMILPNTPFEIDQRWSGIMGVGKEKKPIIRKVSPNIIAAIRMGGMGIAIGSLVGEITAQEIS